MNTHTPGPWHIGMKPGPTVYGPQGEQITWSANPLLDEQEHQANQRLIAAAPELLEALKRARDYYAPIAVYDDANQGEHDSVIRAMETAIAKAEGRG